MSRTGKISKYLSWALSTFALIPGVSPIHAGGDTEVQARSTIQAAIQPPIEEDPIATRGPLTSADIDAMNSMAFGKRYTFAIAENPATRQPMHELCGLIPPTEEQLKEMASLPQATVVRGLPSQFDCRQNGGNVTVRAQGGCGSCWAFATMGALECNIKMKDKTEVNLSEQYLVSCNGHGWSCNGGWLAFEVVKNGVPMESCYPYTGTTGTCKSGCEKPYSITSYGNIENSTDALKSAIIQYGPIAVTVAADTYFQAYNGGVFNRNYGGSVNHAVVLVGWDDSTQSWIMRNSWGSGWGESGYMRIQYGCSKIGSNGQYCVYKGGTPPPSFMVTISPTSATINVGATKQFTASVNGTSDTAVTWSCTGGGTVSQTGLYTAPSTACTATMKATSHADTSKSATAIVTVGSSTTYALTVNSGSGDGNYASGAKVTITANAAPTGKTFDKWVATSGSPAIANLSAATTTLTMPTSAATVTATYKDTGTVPTLTLSKPTYAVNEKIVVTYASLPSIYTNWISIFKAGAANTQYMQWFYTKGAKSGTMTFSGLAAGQYEMRLFYNDSYTLVKKVAFTVK